MQGPCPLTYTPRGAGLTSQVSFLFFLPPVMPFLSCFFATPILLLDTIIFVECCLYINLSTAMGGNLLLSNPWKPKKSNVIKPSETSTAAALRYTISFLRIASMYHHMVLLAHIRGKHLPTAPTETVPLHPSVHVVS